MEFFRHIDCPLDEYRLQQFLTLHRLPECCSAIDRLMQDHGSRGVIYCLWGQFVVNRELIRGGVRFSLPDCPNALSWTIARNGSQKIAIHCTINQQTQEADFIESINAFMDAWQLGLGAALKAAA